MNIFKIILGFLLISFIAEGQISLTFPVSRMVFQRNNNNYANVFIAGNFDTFIDKVEARVVPIQSGQGNATDWTVIQTNPQNSYFYGSIYISGGWYNLEVRGSINGYVVGTSIINRVGVGEVFMVAGQSNATGFVSRDGSGNVVDDYGAKPSSDDRVNRINFNQDSWGAGQRPPYPIYYSHIDQGGGIAPRGDGSWCWGELGDYIAQRYKVPVLFFNVAIGGSSIANWQQSATTSYALPYSNMLMVMQYYINQTGIRAVLWDQGEAEIDQNTSQSSYYNNLNYLINKSRQDYGRKISWVVSRTSLVRFTQTYAPVIAAQNQAIDPNNQIFAGPITDNIQNPRPTGEHFKNFPGGSQGISDLARGWNSSLDDNFFNQSQPVLTDNPTRIINVNCTTDGASLLYLPDGYSYEWSDGSTNRTITNKGTYSAIIRDGSGKFYFSPPVNTANLNLDKFSIFGNGSTTFCDGAGISISSNSTMQNFLWNNGQTSSSIFVTTPGAFNVKSLSSSNCPSITSNTITTNVLPTPAQPSILSNGSLTVCEGSSVVLNSSSSLNSYWENPNATNTQSVAISNVGSYATRLRVLGNNGCFSPYSATANVVINKNPSAPTITNNGSLIACEGKNIILTANSSLNTYKTFWNSTAKDSTKNLTLSKSGDYSLNAKIQDLNGCFSPFSAPTVNVAIRPTPATPIVNQIGAFTLEAKQINTIIGDIFEWRKDSTLLTTKTSQIIKTGTQGSYSADILRTYSLPNNQTLACRSPYSNLFNYTPDPLIDQFAIYPNPSTTGVFTIEAKDDLKNVSVQIFNLNGRLVDTGTIPVINNRELFDMSSMVGGEYIIKIQNDAFKTSKRIMIDKK